MTTKTPPSLLDIHKPIKGVPKNPCKICTGSGYLTLGTADYRRPCVCTLRFIYRKALGEEIYNARKLKESPYSERVNTDLFITANRRDILPHIRHAMITQGTQFFFRVTNDSEMIDAWLSKDKESSKEEGTTEVTFTSLRDLVEDPQLLIIMLGVMSYQNKALPGVFLEALRIRQFRGKPTWVITPRTRPLVSGNLAWSPEVEEYLIENFKAIEIKSTQQTESLYRGIMPTVEDENQESQKERQDARNQRAGDSVLEGLKF
jgi:hypothetical protein